MNSNGMHLVSVLVVAYNHEIYIKKCLDSVIHQECNFNYEIVISEDCSTDNTLDVCMEYRQKLDGKIRILVGKSNLGMMKNIKRGLQACRGEYIAIIEGDDFWIDEKKLQKQYDILNHNRNLGMCFTRSIIINRDGTKLQSWNFGEQSKRLETKEIFSKDFITILPTASIFIRADNILPLPSWFEDARVADVFIIMAGCRRNGAYYLADNTACYRYQSVGSWTSKGAPQNFEGLLDHNTQLMKHIFIACNEYKIPYSILSHRFASNNWIGFILSIKKRDLKQSMKFISRVPLKYLIDGLIRRINRLKKSILPNV